MALDTGRHRQSTAALAAVLLVIALLNLAVLDRAVRPARAGGRRPGRRGRGRGTRTLARGRKAESRRRAGHVLPERLALLVRRRRRAPPVRQRRRHVDAPDQHAARRRRGPRHSRLPVRRGLLRHRPPQRLQHGGAGGSARRCDGHPGAGVGRLYAISCTTQTRCMAIGRHDRGRHLRRRAPPGGRWPARCPRWGWARSLVSPPRRGAGSRATTTAPRGSTGP